METKIKNNINNPEQLEQYYRADKKDFKRAFLNTSQDFPDSDIVKFWRIRLDNKISTEIGNEKSKIGMLVLICLITGALVKLPQIFDLNMGNYSFYEKNVSMIILLGLSTYSFITSFQINFKHLAITVLVFIVSGIYMNLLPSDVNSQSINLIYIHLPMMLWFLYGLIYIGFDIKDKAKRIDYIRYNGDVVILASIILIAGVLLTMLTLGLFSAIDVNIDNFYFDYIVILGLVSSPIVATYILKRYTFITNKIAPIIAGIFSPLILITLVIYLISIFYKGKDPYNDREFLIVFNLLLLGVMAIIIFSVSEISLNKKQKFNKMILFLLSLFTLIVDLIALTAILYRLGEFGFTPNRTAVLGSNLLIFGNLVFIMIGLFKVNFRNQEIKNVEIRIAKYLPIYCLWTIFVVFVLPLLYKLK